LARIGWLMTETRRRHMTEYRQLVEDLFDKLRDNTACRRLVDEILDGDPVQHGRACKDLFVYVWQRVLMMRLPIGPLREDRDERADIAVCVMKKLEAGGYERLRDWRCRQIARQDHATFKTFIGVVAYRAAIDHARSHPRQVAPRNKSFAWITEEAKDPLILAETVQRQLGFLDGASAPELCEHLERFSAATASGNDTAAVGSGTPAPKHERNVSRHVIRRR
jgi:hypothetical protein